jgi:hypothetical protein
MTCQQASKINLVAYLSNLGLLPEKKTATEYFYQSPFVPAAQVTGSLAVHLVKNKFYCHATGIGGTLIEFLRALHPAKSISQILKELSDTEKSFSFLAQQTPNTEPPSKTTLQIEKVKVLENKALTDYLASRHIPLHIARRYVQECYYRIDNSQKKPYFALHFGNDKGGAELRNKHFKGSTSPKTVSTIKGKDSNKVCVFEGFIDFLSAMVHFNKPICEYDVIVLNSVSNLSQANLGNYQAIKLYLDNDQTGKQAAEVIKNSYQVVTDYAYLYAAHKDFNEWLCSKKQNPFAK